MLKRVPIERVAWLDVDKVSCVHDSEYEKADGSVEIYIYVLVDGQWMSYSGDECAVVLRMIEQIDWVKVR